MKIQFLRTGVLFTQQILAEQHQKIHDNAVVADTRQLISMPEREKYK